jgi:hypothetical protein
MEKKQNILEKPQDLLDDPEKLKVFLKRLPESEGALIEKAIKVNSEIKSNREDIKAERIIRKARTIEKFKEEASKRLEKKSDPFFILEMETQPISGVTNDEIYYSTGYLGAGLIWEDFIILRDQGGAFFNFTPNLPIGTYLFYTDWYTVAGPRKCKIRCTAHPSPTSAVSPQGSIEKYTEEPSAGIILDGAEMIWRVESVPNYGVLFCIRNISGDDVVCFGAAFLGLY